MRGKLMFITGLAAGFVLGSRAGREKYEEIAANAKKVWEHPSVQEAAGVAQAQANKLYSESKDKLSSSKLGEKLSTTSSTDTTDSSVTPVTPATTSTTSTTSTTTSKAPVKTTDSLAGSTSKSTGTSF